MAMLRWVIGGMAMTSMMAHVAVQTQAQDGQRGGIGISIPDIGLPIERISEVEKEAQAQVQAEAERLKRQAQAAAAEKAAELKRAAELANRAGDDAADGSGRDNDNDNDNGNGTTSGNDTGVRPDPIDIIDSPPSPPSPIPRPRPKPVPTPTPPSAPTATPEPPPLVMNDAVIDDYVAGDVVYFTGNSRAEIRRIAADNGLTVRQISRLDQLNISMVSARIQPGDTVNKAVARLNAVGAVEWAQPNIAYQLLGNSRSRGLAMHGLGSDRPQHSSGGAVIGPEAVIVLIDSPVDSGHESLLGAKVKQVGIGIDLTPASHGTAIAELLVGSGDYEGAARGAQLISIPAFSQSQVDGWQSTTEWLMLAFNEAARLRPNVANLSFGSRLSDPGVERILALLEERGVCVASAAGNGAGGPVLFPARAPSTVAIAAVDDKRRAYDYGSRGPEVDIAAWGVSMNAAVPGGRRLVSGTSFATALVAGAMLRMPACNGGRAPAVMRGAIIRDAEDLGEKGRDDIFGAGLFRLGETGLAPIPPGAALIEEAVAADKGGANMVLLGTGGAATAAGVLFFLWRRKKKRHADGP